MSSTLIYNIPYLTMEPPWDLWIPASRGMALLLVISLVDTAVHRNHHTPEDSAGVSRHRLEPVSPTFYISHLLAGYLDTCRMAAPDLRHGLEVQRTSVQKQTHLLCPFTLCFGVCSALSCDKCQNLKKINAQCKILRVLNYTRVVIQASN